MVDRAGLEHLVKRVAGQIRRRRAEHYALRGAFYGAVVALLPLLVKGWIGSLAYVLGAVAIAVGAGMGAIVGLALASPLADVARVADRGFGLEDRVATALEWASRPDRTPLVDALLRDAVAHVERLHVTSVVGRMLPREARWLPVPLLLGVALVLAPAVPLPAGSLPDLSGGAAEDQAKEERAGSLQASDQTRAKSEPMKPGALSERDVVKTAGGGVTQSGDRPALFKDTSLSGERPDFSSFVKKGDERLRLLEQVDRLPDLKSDYTGSEYRMVAQQSKSLTAAAKGEQVPEERLKELLEQIEKLGQKDPGSQAGDAAAQGLRSLQAGSQEKAMEAMNRALNALRQSDENRKGAMSLKGGKQGESGRRSSESGESREHGSPDQEDPGASKGKMAGTGPGREPKGDPTPRLRATTYDTTIEGEHRDGQKDSINTNFYGQAASVPSRLRYVGAYEQYRKMMEDAIAREQVPRDYQPQVKEYFRALGEK